MDAGKAAAAAVVTAPQKHPQPLRVCKGGRTAVVFVTHEHNRNTRFFLRHGLEPDANVTYVIVQNDVTLKDPVRETTVTQKALGLSNVTWIRRPNMSNDWGAYSAAVRHLDLQAYDYFVFLNSTMRGPFMPAWWHDDRQGVARPHWTTLFTRKLSDSVAMVGSSINWHGGQPHVQSMLMVMDQRALQLMRAAELFMSTDRHVSKMCLVTDFEIGSSQLLMKRGYNIDCMLRARAGRDWRQGNAAEAAYPPVERSSWWGTNLWFPKRFFGNTDVNLFETMFYKTNCGNNGRNKALELQTRLQEHEGLEAAAPYTYDAVWNPADGLETLGPLQVEDVNAPSPDEEDQAAARQELNTALTAAAHADAALRRLQHRIKRIEWLWPTLVTLLAAAVLALTITIVVLKKRM